MLRFVLQKHFKSICMNSGRLKTYKNDAYHGISGVLKNDLKIVSTPGEPTFKTGLSKDCILNCHLRSGPCYRETVVLDPRKHRGILIQCVV